MAKRRRTRFVLHSIRHCSRSCGSGAAITSPAATMKSAARSSMHRRVRVEDGVRPSLRQFSTYGGSTGRGKVTNRRSDPINERLAEVLIDQRRHLEHRHLFLSTEDLLQVVVGIDHALVLLVLQTIGFDVIPNLLGHFTARNRFASNDRREVGARLNLCSEALAATLSTGTLFRSRHSFPFFTAVFRDCGLPSCARSNGGHRDARG